MAETTSTSGTRKSAKQQEAPAVAPVTTTFVSRDGLREAELSGTELKIWQALRGTGFTEVEVNRAMIAMNDHGITFGDGDNA